MVGKWAALTVSVLCCVVFTGAQIAVSGGYEIAEQTARGIGRGNAITAGVDDPSAVFINPAALSEIPGNQAMVGFNYFNTVGRVKNGGRNSRNIHDDAFLPNLFANYHIPDSNFSVGLGTYTPFGLGTRYQTDGFTRFAAIRSELKTLYVTPAVAWKPFSFLSVAGGLSYVHSSAFLSRALFLGALGVGEGKLSVADSDDAFAYNFGILLTPHNSVKVGITYRSRVDLDYHSADVKFRDALISGGASTRVRGEGIHVPLPPVVSAGIQWQITPDWAAEIDYKFTRWSEFESLRIRFASPLPALGGAVPISALVFPQRWKDASSVRLGTSYKLTENVEIRAGIGYDQSPIPSKSLGPAIPGAHIFGLNGGVGYTWGPLGIDLGYGALFYRDRRISNAVLEGTNVTAFSGTVPLPALTPPGLSGRDKYENFINHVSLHVRYRF